MIAKVVCATGDLSTAEKEHKNTRCEVLYDTFVALEGAVIVRFERVFYSIVHVQGVLGSFRRSGLHQMRRGL